MDDGEVFLVDLDTHLQSHVFFKVEAPRTGMANDFAIGWFQEQRPFPESRRQGIEAQRGEETFTVTNHLLRVCILRLEYLRQVITAIGVCRSEQRIDISPRLRPHVTEQVR